MANFRVSPFSRGRSILGAAVTTCVMIVALYVYGTRHGFTIEQWASWVQAVGSISALLVALGLADYQAKLQRSTEQEREAKQDMRIANFAEAVIREAIDAVLAVELSQRSWMDGVGYIYHERSRIAAVQDLTRTLVTEPLFLGLINPVIDTHALLVAVDSASEQLVGQTNFKSNSRFELFWRQQGERMAIITVDREDAVATAHRVAACQPVG